jgi:hypothetical protein
VELKVDGAHQLLSYADDVNLLGDNIATIRKTTETLTGASKEVGLEINVEKTRHQNVSQNHYIKIANRSFGNVSRFTYLGTTVTNQNLIDEKISKNLNSGNACYQSAHSLFSSRLLSRNVKIGIYWVVILSAVLYGCESLSLKLREEHRMMVFENRVLRRIFEENCITMSFVICTLRQV